MIELTIMEKIVLFVECPECRCEVQIEAADEPEGEEEDLYCAQCGCIMAIEVAGDGKISVSIRPEKLLPVYVLLKSRINERTVYFVLKRRADSDVASETADILYENEADFINSQQFFYDVGCPPSLFLRDLICIIGDGDENSGGMFEYVGTRKAEFDDDDPELEEKLKRLFREELSVDGSLWFDA